MTDFLSKEERSRLMSKIHSKNTGIEKKVFSILSSAGLRFNKHSRELPGTPDIVFPKIKMAIFLDGGFWHGYKFQSWKENLSFYWINKIEANIARDKRNRRRLRNHGWIVLRFWQHEIEKDVELVALLIMSVHYELSKSKMDPN